jgi:hypothetical protein
LTFVNPENDRHCAGGSGTRPIKTLKIFNNGIEFAATYGIMLLVLLFIDGGRCISVDYWINRSLS